MDLSSKNCRVVHLSPIYQFAPVFDVLRLDEIHPVVSGNKWFKLKEYIKDAKAKDKKILLTFGGAYSNHIIATAAAAHMNAFESIGIIRGEEPLTPSHTLMLAVSFGMKMYFVSRELYKSKTVPEEVFSKYHGEEIYVIPEGGYGEKGMTGAKEILQQSSTSSYTHFISSTGTGTTLAGITAAASNNQKVIGVSALKNNFSLQHEIENLLPPEKHQSFELLHNYHFGGYARHTKQLVDFMNDLYSKADIPTDFVYTAKALFAAFDLISREYFTVNDKILFIHTGGLQGNRSLLKGTLIYG